MNKDEISKFKEELWDFESTSKNIQNDLLKSQEYFAKQIQEEGEELLKQIEKKRKKHTNKKDDLISYILKKTNLYDEDELYHYDYRDVVDIYNDVKYQYRPWWVKFFEMFFR